MNKYLFLVLLFSINCSSDKSSKNHLIGVWEVESNSNLVFEFTEDGYFNQYISGEKVIFSSFEKVNRKYEEVDYGKMLYKIDQQGDSLMVNLFGENNNKFYDKYLCFVDGDHLTLANYKQGEGIDNHLQMVNSFFRQGTKKRTKGAYKSLSLVLPTGFNKNEILIAFGQKNGSHPIVDSDGNITLNIPQSGLLKTTFVEDLRIISKGRVRIFRKNTNEVDEIHVFQFDELALLNSDYIQGRYDPKLIVGFVERFNPSRDLLNKLFDENILGNVQTFSIDTLEKRIH